MSLIIISLLFLIWTKNPLFAVLSLISIFVNSSILLLQLKYLFFSFNLCYNLCWRDMCVVFIRLNAFKFTTLDLNEKPSKLLHLLLHIRLLSLLIYMYSTKDKNDSFVIDIIMIILKFSDTPLSLLFI